MAKSTPLTIEGLLALVDQRRAAAGDLANWNDNNGSYQFGLREAYDYVAAHLRDIADAANAAPVRCKVCEREMHDWVRRDVATKETAPR